MNTNGHKLIKKRGGFTLIELLVVMIIMGVLVSLLMPAFSKVRDKGRRVQRDAEMAGIRSGIKAYFLEYGNWPLSPTDLARTNVVWFRNDNKEVIDRLRVNDPFNPKKILFLETENFRQIGTAYVDPWDNPYYVGMDPRYPGPDVDRDFQGGVKVWYKD